MVLFTKPAREKFKILKKHEFIVTESQVLRTVREPQFIDRTRLPLLIAQSRLNHEHVLRVVYKEEKGDIKIITFYPGRRSQYEKKQ